MDFDEKMCQGITHIWLQQQVDVKYVWLVPGDMVHSCCPSENVKRWTITQMPELSTIWKLTDKSSRRADCKTARLFLSVECERKKKMSVLLVFEWPLFISCFLSGHTWQTKKKERLFIPVVYKKKNKSLPWSQTHSSPSSQTQGTCVHGD